MTYSGWGRLFLWKSEGTRAQVHLLSETKHLASHKVGSVPAAPRALCFLCLRASPSVPPPACEPPVSPARAWRTIGAAKWLNERMLNNEKVRQALMFPHLRDGVSHSTAQGSREELKRGPGPYVRGQFTGMPGDSSNNKAAVNPLQTH